MKTRNEFTWMRLMRTVLALTLVFAMLLCGCAELPKDDGKQDDKENSAILGDGDGKLEAQDAVDGVSAVYGLLLKLLGGELEMDGAANMAMQSEIVVTLGDEFKTQLGQALLNMDPTMDLSWFKNLGLSMTTITEGDLTQMGVGVNINGKNIASANIIMDMLGGMMYASLPGINDKTIGMPMNNTPQPAPSPEIGMGGTLVGPGQDDEMEAVGGIGIAPSMMGMLLNGDITEIFAEHKELVQALPSEKQMNKLISGYMELVLECLDEGTTAEETLTQGDVSQKVDATTYVITQHDLLDAAIAVLTKAKTDAELEKALDAFGALMNAVAAQQDEEAEPVDLHEEMMDEIDSLLEDLQDTKANTEDDEMLRFSTYTANDKTVGFQLTLTAMDAVARPEDEVDIPKDEAIVQPVSAEEPERVSRMTFYSLEDGNKTAFYLNLADSVQLSGTGTVSGKKTSGNYSLKLGGVEYLQIEVKDFTADALNSETLEGTLRLRFGQGMLGRMQGKSIFFSEDTMVELQLKIDGEKVDVNAKLFSGETFFFGIATSMKTIQADKIQVPTDYVDVTGQGQMAQWLSGMNLDAVLKNLEEADVPTELVQMLKDLMENGFSAEEGEAVPPNEMYPEYDY